MSSLRARFSSTGFSDEAALAPMAADHTIAIFVAQLILLLFVGRLLGEGLSRIGQPAIFGQLLAGVLLGPSVFGALMPGLHQVLFPDTAAVRSMVDGLSQIGILLLLLLTGMETNLALIHRRRRAVIATSALGIVVPFGCGIALAYALPSALIPAPNARLVTALFLGTALAISSVKIVAMVLMEVGAVRRDLGQLILATAILDDTIAWVLIAVIAGRHGGPGGHQRRRRRCQCCGRAAFPWPQPDSGPACSGLGHPLDERHDDH
jgi:Kef-type K+ transport system membrane component KefB